MNSTRETVTAIGVAVVIATVGGGAIYAATDSGTRSMGGNHQFGPAGPGPGGPPPLAAGPGADTSGAGSLHGEFVVAIPRGGYRTEVTQTGEVAAASATSVTVRSADGYHLAYSLSSPSAPPLVVGDEVTVRGHRVGDTVTATSINQSNAGP